MPFDAELAGVTGKPQPLTNGSDVIYFVNFSPDAQSVVFDSQRGATSHIWRFDLGASPIQLTSDPKFDETYPRYSPDGKTIAFCRKESTNLEANNTLWLMAADGADPQPLPIQLDRYFAWASNGGSLVYFSALDSQLYSYELSSKVARRLTDEPGVSPVVATSPDGKWLMYQSNIAGNTDIRAVRSEGGSSRVVVATTHLDYHPFVSPSGKWLYFQFEHKNIYRVPGPAQDWRPKIPEKITNFPESGLFIEDPQISRDGKQLLYTHGRFTGDIWMLELGN